MACEGKTALHPRLASRCRFETYDGILPRPRIASSSFCGKNVWSIDCLLIRVTVELPAGAPVTGPELETEARELASPKSEQDAAVSFETLLSEHTNADREEEEEMLDETASGGKSVLVATGGETPRPMFPPTYFFTEWQVQQLASHTDGGGVPEAGASDSGGSWKSLIPPHVTPSESITNRTVDPQRFVQPLLNTDLSGALAGGQTSSLCEGVSGQGTDLSSGTADVAGVDEQGLEPGVKFRSAAGPEPEAKAPWEGAGSGHEETAPHTMKGRTVNQSEQPESTVAIQQSVGSKPAPVVPVSPRKRLDVTTPAATAPSGGVPDIQGNVGERGHATPQGPSPAAVNTAVPGPRIPDAGTSPAVRKPAWTDGSAREVRLKEVDKDASVVPEEAVERSHREEFERQPSSTVPLLKGQEPGPSPVQFSVGEEPVGYPTVPHRANAEVRIERAAVDHLRTERTHGSSIVEAAPGRPQAPASAVQLAVTGERGEDVQATVRVTQHGVEVRIQTRTEGLHEAIALHTPYLRNRLEDVQRTDNSTQWDGAGPPAEIAPQRPASTDAGGQRGWPEEDVRSGGDGRGGQRGDRNSPGTQDGSEQEAKEEEVFSLLEGVRKT